VVEETPATVRKQLTRFLKEFGQARLVRKLEFERARSAFIEQACAGDEELRQQVLLLLASEANTAGFVEAPAPEVAVKRPIGNEDVRRSPSADRFLPGAILAGRYRVVAILGKGGMGEEYRADDLTLGQTVALKFLPEAAARDGAESSRMSDLDRYLAEAERQVANHRGARYAVQLRINVGPPTRCSDRISKRIVAMALGLGIGTAFKQCCGIDQPFSLARSQ